MESLMQRENICPMLCNLKAVLFVVVAVFVLYLPLGDPHDHCESVAPRHEQRIAMCYLCEAYFLAEKAANKALEATQFVICSVIDLLYEAKLKFYTILEKMDKDDLCSSVCCARDEEPEEVSKASRCPNCKCVRNRCRSSASCRSVQR